MSPRSIRAVASHLMRTAILLALVLAVAAVDWWAVARGLRRLEVVAKPLTLVALIVATLALLGTDTAESRWLLAGLVLSLTGDVLLLSETSHAFLAGLAAFLGAHLAYVAAFAAAGISWSGTLIGLAIVAALVATLGRRIISSVRATEPGMVVPVVAYVIAISAMVVAAFGRELWTAAAGALSFYLSDATIAWARFVAPVRYGRLVIMATYHVGQVLIVGSFL